MKTNYMKSHAKVFLFFILDMWRSKIQNTPKLIVHLIFNKVNQYFEETNRNKHFALVTTNESKVKI